MCLEFIPIKTEDGTISLYNFNIKDVYHSKIGAYTEALNKYVIPSGVLDFVKHNNEVRILDVCFGLGYNSRVAVAEILKINPDCRIIINAIEIDPTVLALSCILDDDLIFFEAISAQIDVKKIIEDYFEEMDNYSPEISKILPAEYKSVEISEMRSFLHNIYYRTISARNIRSCNHSHANGLLTIDFFIKDGRSIIKELNTKFDFIFHDPFTPSKTPILWTVEFFNELFRILDENGNITTYSSSSPIRAGLIESGFFIGQTKPIGKKTTGTIAYKNKSFIKNELSEKEKGLLNTRAGTPFRDENFMSTSEEILLFWEEEKKNSNKVSSSSFLKTK